MHVIRWSVVLLFLTGALMWLAAVTGFEPASWQYSLRMAGGIYFLLALAASGVMSIPSVHRKASSSTVPREDWAFIFIVCTISLFGISLWFD
ncbi:hypothetical protein [Salinithrix halophila]|uniref:Uncharacterized protein n=1 Tax=Salinithrix halophila TaxID=1485204 RepID=A0ABV8JEG1_9BACL